jgi:hypothetical protein
LIQPTVQTGGGSPSVIARPCAFDSTMRRSSNVTSGSRCFVLELPAVDRGD